MWLSDVLLSNLLAWALQSACIAVAATVAIRILPMPAAELRYGVWRVALLACFAVPWLPGNMAPPIPAMDTDAAVFAVPPGTVELAGTTPPTAMISWSLLVWAALGVIVALRALWLLAGIVHLGRLRRAAVIVETEELAEVQRNLATRAEIRYAATVPQPVTFGLRRPVILLPASLADAPATLRRAVTTHELLHVQRRDWGWVLLEEGLRTIFWFNPATWWLTARIQQAREEVVDHLTVLAIGSRRDYIEALLAFADASPPAPAPAFARRAHLFTRIMRISKESAMSSVRVLLSALVILAIVAAAGVSARAAFPVTALAAAPPAAPTTASALEPQERPAGGLRPITPDNPIPRRTYSVTPLHPPGHEDLTAMVQVVVRLDRFGTPTVREMRAVATFRSSDSARLPGTSGSEAGDAFYKAAAAAIAQWRYDAPAEAPIEFIVAVRFTPNQTASVAQFESESASETAWRDDARRGLAPPVPPPPPPPGVAGRRGGGPGVVGGVVGRVPPPAGAPIRIGGAIKTPVKTFDVPPVYPEIAKTARVQGIVIAEVVIDEQGGVTSASILRSIPLLDQAALDAVRQWQFTPTRLNGAPVPVIMTVTVQFTLSEN